MKKTKTLILSICIAAAMLAGCGSKTDAPADTAATTTATTTEEGTTEASAEAETTEAETAEATEAVTEKDSSDSASNPGLGSWDGDTYHNEFAQLTFNLPEEWVAATEEEMAALMGVGADVLADSGVQFSEKLMELQSLFAMMVQNPNTSSNVSLTFENLNLVIGGSKTTEDEYIDVLKSTLSQVQDMTYSFGDVYEEEISGNTYKVLEGTLEEYGVTQYYYIRKVDKTMIALIVTVVGEETVEDVLTYFE